VVNAFFGKKLQYFAVLNPLAPESE